MREYWLKTIHDGKIEGTVNCMVDFRKSFDLVDHDLLLQNLDLCRCSNNFLKLMKSHPSNISQAESLGGKCLKRVL